MNNTIIGWSLPASAVLGVGDAFDEETYLAQSWPVAGSTRSNTVLPQQPSAGTAFATALGNLAVAAGTAAIPAIYDALGTQNPNLVRPAGPLAPSAAPKTETPSWLLPAGIGAALLVAFLALKR